MTSPGSSPEGAGTGTEAAEAVVATGGSDIEAVMSVLEIRDVDEVGSGGSVVADDDADWGVAGGGGPTAAGEDEDSNVTAAMPSLDIWAVNGVEGGGAVAADVAGVASGFDAVTVASVVEGRPCAELVSLPSTRHRGARKAMARQPFHMLQRLPHWMELPAADDARITLPCPTMGTRFRYVP